MPLLIVSQPLMCTALFGNTSFLIRTLCSGHYVWAQGFKTMHVHVVSQKQDEVGAEDDAP